jgi:NTP pyrophosphatase (non-canonical NTP hydrolase)
MNLKEYATYAIKTLTRQEEPLQDDVHMLMGMTTEVGELTDAYKKHLFYPKPLDVINVKEEIGDLMWYVVNFCNINGWDLESILEQNVKKLKTRYPKDIFETEKANKRDLFMERMALEENKEENGRLGR